MRAAGAVIGMAATILLSTTFQEPLSPPERLRIAESLFQDGIRAGEDRPKARELCHDAAAQYQKLADLGFDDPDLFLNLGNAYYLADELPQAILAYRRGLRRHPLHPQLLENLEAARDAVGYPRNLESEVDVPSKQRPAAESWPAWLPRPAPESLARLALVLYSLGWLAAGGWSISRRAPAVVLAILLFLAAGTTAAWWGYLDYMIAQDEEQPLVVVAVNGVTLRRGNAPLYPHHPDLPVVNRGMEARLVNERGGWVQVQFPGGEAGWLPGGAVLVDKGPP